MRHFEPRFFKVEKAEVILDEWDFIRPFYVFGCLAIRGGDYYYGDSHRRKCNMLKWAGFRKELTVGGDLIINSNLAQIRDLK
jgi:hypothetical protein